MSNCVELKRSYRHTLISWVLQIVRKLVFTSFQTSKRRYIMLYYFMSCNVMSYHAMLRYAMLRFVMLRYGVFHHSMLFCFTLWYIVGCDFMYIIYTCARDDEGGGNWGAKDCCDRTWLVARAVPLTPGIDVEIASASRLWQTSLDVTPKRTSLTLEEMRWSE